MIFTKKIFSFKQGLLQLVHQKMEQFTNALNTYVNDKLRNLGLYSQNVRVNVFNNIGSTRSFNKAGLSKIRGYLIKFINKNSLYLGNAKAELVRLNNVTSEGLLEIEVVTDYKKMVIDSDKWMRIVGARMPSIRSSSNWNNNNSYFTRYLTTDDLLYKVLKRYVRYLNYLIRKNHIPLLVQVSPKLQGIESELQTLYLENLEPKDFNPKVKISYTISFENYKNVLVRNGIFTQLESYANLTDSDYAQESRWHSTAGSSLSSDYDFVHALQPDANIAKHFDNLIPILNSLSRKTSYDLSAYSFRAASDS